MHHMKKILLLTILLLAGTLLFPLRTYASSAKVVIVGDSYSAQTYIDDVRADRQITSRTNTSEFRNCWENRLAVMLGLDTRLQHAEKNKLSWSKDVVMVHAGGTGVAGVNDGRNWSDWIEVSQRYTNASEVQLVVFGSGLIDVKNENYKGLSAAMEKLIRMTHAVYPQAAILLSPFGWGKYSENEFPSSFVFNKDRKGYCWERTIQSYMTRYVVPVWKKAAEQYPYVYYADGSEKLSGYFCGTVR